jgi:hypothetical protein
MTGLCGILWVVSIDFNGPVANQQQQMGQGLGTNIINKTETTLSDEVSKEYHPFRLTVPFYVYENRDLNWEDATLDGEPYEPIAPHGGGAGTYVALFPACTLQWKWKRQDVHDRLLITPRCFVSFYRSSDGKHSDDYWYMRAAMIHPMRTMDPNEAKLFFVPVCVKKNR